MKVLNRPFLCFQIRSLKTGLNTEYLRYFVKINKVPFKTNSRNLNHVQVHLALDDYKESSIYLTWVSNFCNSVYSKWKSLVLQRLLRYGHLSQNE